MESQTFDFFMKIIKKNQDIKIAECLDFTNLPEKGLEPPRYCYQWILSPPRLPFRHSGLLAYNTVFMRDLSSVIFVEEGTKACITNSRG